MAEASHNKELILKIMRRSILNMLAVGSTTALLFAVVPASSHAQSPAARQAPAQTSVEKEKETADKTLSAFQGVKWGTTVKEARTQLEKRGIEISKLLSSDTVLYMRDMDVAGYKPLRVSMHFDEDGFYQALVTFKVQSANRTIPFYNEVKSVVEERFGKPQVDKFEIKPPFAKKDNTEELAIAANSAEISSVWFFKEGTETRALLLGISENLNVTLFYVDDQRSAAHRKREKQKRAKTL